MTSLKPLDKKNAIITGASCGIGRGIAKELASRGANVLITFSTSAILAQDLAQELEEIYGVSTIVIQAQANDPGAPAAIVKAAVEKWGCIDIIVNNAAIREDYDFMDMTPEVWQLQLMANLQFPVFLVKEAVPSFGKAPRIVNLSSSYSQDGHAGCLAYVAAKGAMEAVTRSLSREIGQKYNAIVNCVRPGPVNTELWKRSITEPEVLARWNPLIQNTPAAPRVAEVEDIAQVVGFLVSEDTKWVTGSVINASGGLMFQ
ncbi:hypothetical protein ASPZODRAFT_77549 [Penicilliopsis zonata CBS 506.65]|uniref:3-oxoacyl-[acyl-carrier-protein] reductase n=1 Tax=Penicilliopsis zonata CBS 506.65 TaxID=1073090 RepID=A0A1L9S4V5_9EURO|nr:hypothetical protein ASPZODRAFT_77549 [Penicilliopsis zonata CBS 506.65]OJJ42173.1 hypothetical protein ASPZODRAFT_77549 [Penicilliopsis zonata CBS 506.65]